MRQRQPTMRDARGVVSCDRPVVQRVCVGHRGLFSSWTSKLNQVGVASPDFSFALIAAKAPDHPLANAANIALAAAM